jgi:hypothetical protein
MTNDNKITLSFSKLLQRLLLGEKIPEKLFSSGINKSLLQKFTVENILLTTSQRTKYLYCPNNEYLHIFLSQHFGITDLEKYTQFLEKKETTRAEATENTSNSKHKKGRIFNGFFLKTYLPLTVKIENQIFPLQPFRGIWLYIENYKTLEIENDITIVGVENSETFTFIENYKHLFSDIKPLFLLRYNNNAYIEWLQKIPNNYLHFGDFDLSAIAIYITEFKNKLKNKNCKFFIPENIDELIISSKNKEDYLKQLNDKRVVGLNLNENSELNKLIELINSNKRTVEQEILMKF